MKNWLKSLMVVALCAMPLMIVSCNDDKDDESSGSQTPNNPNNPDTPSTGNNPIETALVGKWEYVYEDNYGVEIYNYTLKSDYTGLLVENKGGQTDSETFVWSYDKDSRIISLDFGEETDYMQLLGISPKYAVIAEDGEECLYVRKSVAPAFSIVASDNYLLGKWLGYDGNNGSNYLMEIEIKADGTSSMNIFSMEGMLLSSDEAVWMPGLTSNTVNTYFVDSSNGDVDSEPYRIYSSPANTLVLNRIGHDETFSLLKKGTEKTVTKQLLQGNWKCDGDLYQLNADGTGVCNNPGPSGEQEFEWTFDAASQTLTIKEAALDSTIEYNILLANENICFCSGPFNSINIFIRQ